MTSHSLNAKGKYNKNRNRLIHFTLKKQKLNSIKVIENFREWILSSYPELKKSAKLKKVQKQGGLNIEPRKRSGHRNETVKSVVDKGFYWIFWLYSYPEACDSWLFKISKSRKKPHEPENGKKYPGIIEVKGKKPEQYPEWE